MSLEGILIVVVGTLLFIVGVVRTWIRERNSFKTTKDEEREIVP